MRIAHVITRMIIGGAQENTLLTCLDLRRLHGDDVLLLTGPAIGPEGDLLARRADEINFEVVEIDSLRRAIHPWRDWRSLRELKRQLRRFQPQVVHTHSAKGGFLGRLAGWSRGVPAVLHTVHGNPFPPSKWPAAAAFYRRCETYAARRCHRLISVADAMTDLMVEARVAPREKCTTIYSGMDVEPFLQAEQQRAATRARWGLKDEHVVIGKIARLFELKGHEFLISAARRVVDKNPQVRFLLVGDGVLRPRLEALIEAGGLTPNFILVGLVSPAEIPALVGAMDVLVHASLREGLARALPQALIAGKPAVSYDVDGAREVVIDGVTGRLLPPRAVEPLADALIELSADEPLRRRLGAEGRRRFTDQFRHETMTARIRQAYQDVLDGDSPGGAPRK